MHIVKATLAPFEYEVSGSSFILLKQPCIYGWFREDKCLYIGRSSHGIERPLGRDHHVIGARSPVKPEDRICLWYAVEDHGRVERRLINSLNPTFNNGGHL